MTISKIKNTSILSLSLSLSLPLCPSLSLSLPPSFSVYVCVVCADLEVNWIANRLELGWVTESSGHRYQDVPKQILEDVNKYAREKAKDVDMKD
jgi:hypothetical protein